MKLQRIRDFHSFLSTYFSDSDVESGEVPTRRFLVASAKEVQLRVIAQLRILLQEAELPMDEFGSEANLWFGTADEARYWLENILKILEESQLSTSTLSVKDSNGTLLQEGDAVHVIKDLKVKGGSSDLKRGTLVKKIHLIDDTEVVECRVDGSTLVLKTCFLKKV